MKWWHLLILTYANSKIELITEQEKHVFFQAFLKLWILFHCGPDFAGCQDDVLFSVDV